jgi:segregation and condensation protein B
MQLKSIIETILFAAEKPLTLKELRDIFGHAAEGDLATEASRSFEKVKEKDLLEAIQALNREYDKSGSGLQIREIADACQLVTRSDYVPWLRKLFAEHRPHRLSQPAMETLAIVAYRQPITKVDIEAIRGVVVDGVLQTLLERGLIKISGRADVPGRPLYYATTQAFLEHFGLKNLNDLPAVEELRRVALPVQPAEIKEPDEEVEAEPEKEPEDESAKT